MRFLQSVLLATDFRPASQEAERAVVRLSGALGSRVTLLHVINPLLAGAARIPELRQEADVRLQAVADRLAAAGVQVAEVRIAQGQQSDTILHQAEEVNADLVVIGTGDESAADGFTIGPMAEAVIQHARKPVLAVRPVPPRLEFQTIVCPVDHSAVSRRGLQNAVALAHVFGSRLIVVSVVPEVSWLSFAVQTGRVVGASAEHERQWQEEFDSFVASIEFGNVRWSKELRHGVPHQEIAASAAAHGADLIVMGCTGRSGLAHLLVGSTTRRMLRRLPCSLLTVKEESALEDVFNEDIRTINLLFAEGAELLRNRVYDAACAKFDQVLRKNPYHVRALEGRADACSHLGRYREAEFYRRRAAALREQDWF